MTRIARRDFVLNIVLLIAAPIRSLAQQVPSDQPTAQASGKWNFNCHDPNGSTSTKYVEIQQNGSQVKGHFKGPSQFGRHRRHRQPPAHRLQDKDREVLVFRGRIDGQRVGGVVQGNKIAGTFHDRGGTGAFEGVPAGN